MAASMAACRDIEETRLAVKFERGFAGVERLAGGRGISDDRLWAGAAAFEVLASGRRDVAGETEGPCFGGWRTSLAGARGTC